MGIGNNDRYPYMEQAQPKTLDDHLSDMLDHYATKKAIADAAGVKPPSVNSWYTRNEKKKTKPSLRALLKIEKNSRKKFKAKCIRPELF